MNYLKQLVAENKINERSKINVTSFPPHRGSFFSGWFNVSVGGIEMKVYGSTPAQLGAWEAKDNVANAISQYLSGERQHPPQAQPK